MFGNFFTFGPSIVESGSFYVINSINVFQFQLDLKTAYGTTVIANRVIKRLSSTRFKIHKFFMVELTWLLEDMVNHQNKSKQRHFRISLQTYRLLLELVKKETWIATTYQEYAPYNVQKALTRFRFKPFPEQLEFLQQYASLKQGFQLKGTLLDSEPGSGKALSLDSNVLTPKGFSKMRDIAVGSTVIGSNGQPARVTAVYPQGEVQLYKITFSDGRTEECCENHLWSVRHCGLNVTITTRELIKHFAKPNRRKITIPMLNGEYNGEFSPEDFPMDPYVLGVIMGAARDTLSGTKLTCSDKAIITAIVPELNRLGFKLIQRDAINYRIATLTNDLFGFGKFLKDIGIESFTSTDKMFPKYLLNASYTARMGLIQGLTDACAKTKQNVAVIFVAPSKKLAKQYQYLIRSIGGYAKLEQRESLFKHQGEYRKGKMSYKILIKTQHDKLLFLHSNKKHYLTDKESEEVYLEMVNITPSRVAPAQCITVDTQDHLFVSTSFVLTHNTYTSLVWSAMISPYKTIILVPKHLITDPWLDHLLPTGNRYAFTTPPNVWVSTSKTDPLKANAEFYIFYKEQMRKDNWEGWSFDKIISGLSRNGAEPLKMIIDESHNYNEISSQQTQGMVKFASHPFIGDVLPMSGTPIKAQGRETYPLFCVIDKYFDKFVRDDFLKLYSRDNYHLNELLSHRLGRIKFTINAIQGIGAPPEPEVIRLKFPGVERFTLANIRAEMISYIQERIQYYRENMPSFLYDFNQYLLNYEETLGEDEQARKELAEYRNTVNYFRKYGYNSFADADKSQYCKKIEAQIEAQLRGEDLRYFRFIAPAVKYLSLKVKGEALGNILGKARIDAVTSAVDHLDITGLIRKGEGKTAVYSMFLEAINHAYEKVKGEGCSPLLVHSNSKDAVNKVVAQLDTPKYDSLFTTFSTLSEGVPLLMVNQILLLNAPWRDYVLKQTIARAYRKHQTRKVYVWLVDLDTGDEENVSSRTINVMTYFKEQVDQLLNGGLGITEVGGASMKFKDNAEFQLEDLVPFDIPFFKTRPKFKDRSFISLFD